MEMDQIYHGKCHFTVYCDSELYHDIDCYDDIWNFLRKFKKQSMAKATKCECLFLANPSNHIPEKSNFAVKQSCSLICSTDPMA